MSVAIVLVTHEGIGSALLNVANRIYGSTPLPSVELPVWPNDDPEQVRARLAQLLDRLDEGDGVLVLSDLLGSTPSNIAGSEVGGHRARLITGVSLPMLLRVFNYPCLGLDALAAKALSADGVRDVTPRAKNSSLMQS